MPLYELLCLAKPALDKEVMATMIKAVGKVVYRNGGFVTQMKSFGDQHLAYDIRRPFERYDQAHIWQMDFLAKVDSLAPVDHELRVNDSVLRWVIVKRPHFSTAAERAARLQQALEQPPSAPTPPQAP